MTLAVKESITGINTSVACVCVHAVYENKQISKQRRTQLGGLSN